MLRTGTRAYRLLVVLLLADCVFIVLHLLHVYTDLLPRSRFSIEREAGCGEWFQYLKEAAVVLIVFAMARRNRSRLYLTWAFLFLFVLLDDTCALHERLGHVIASHGGIPPLPGMTGQDIGEVCVWLCVGTVFVVLIGIFHHRARPTAKRVSIRLFALTGLLVLFGAVVDMAHAAAEVERVPLHTVLGTIEDGGEMLTMSLITWFVFRRYWSTDGRAPALHEQ